MPDTLSYWAYGFPSICLCVFGANTLFPTLVLFNAHSLPKEDQALRGAIINAVEQTGRAIGLAIGTAGQVAVQTSQQHGFGGQGTLGNNASRSGLRAANWFSVGLGLLVVCVVSGAFRGAGIIGNARK